MCCAWGGRWCGAHPQGGAVEQTGATPGHTNLLPFIRTTYRLLPPGQPLVPASPPNHMGP